MNKYLCWYQHIKLVGYFDLYFMVQEFGFLFIRQYDYVTSIFLDQESIVRLDPKMK